MHHGQNLNAFYKNALPKLQDDNVTEDSLSSQSLFDQDINSDGYLNSLVPLECFLIIESHANLQEIYTVLCKSVHDIRIKLVTNDTIFGIDKNQSVIDTTIAENHASSAVTTIDDIEFWDWAGRTQSHSLWYCDDISKSPMLRIAVEKALRKSCHDNMVSTEFFEGITTSKTQFMGFVSQHTKQGYLSSFPPSHLCCLELMCTVQAQSLSVHSLPATTFSQICRTDCYS